MKKRRKEENLYLFIFGVSLIFCILIEFRLFLYMNELISYIRFA